MTSEARLKRTALTSHALLSWYSLCLIFLSFLDISQRFEIENSNLISACVSVVILGLSLFIYGDRYNERAEQFKACYLKLKHLYECSLNVPEKMKRYSEILGQYDNQSDADYDEMVFDAFIRKQPLWNANGPVEITAVVFCRVLFWRLLRAGSVLLLYVSPLIAGLLWVRPNGGA